MGLGMTTTLFRLSGGGLARVDRIWRRMEARDVFTGVWGSEGGQGGWVSGVVVVMGIGRVVYVLMKRLGQKNYMDLEVRIRIYQAICLQQQGAEKNARNPIANDLTRAHDRTSPA